MTEGGAQQNQSSVGSGRKGENQAVGTGILAKPHSIIKFHSTVKLLICKTLAPGSPVGFVQPADLPCWVTLKCQANGVNVQAIKRFLNSKILAFLKITRRSGSAGSIFHLEQWVQMGPVAFSVLQPLPHPHLIVPWH